MRERKPVIGITCNFDYRDAVGMVSGMGITGQDWDFVSGDYVYILENAGAIPVLIPEVLFCFCSCVSAHSVELLSDSCFLIVFPSFCKMILSVPVIYRFCLTVVFFVVYRLVCCVSSCLWLYSNILCFKCQ